jgi:predicted dehydrogenase
LSAPTDRLASPELDVMTRLRQSWSVPSRPRPIVIIGAGGVVRTAHLPAYQRLEFPVAGIYDIKREASQDTARDFGVPKVFSSLPEAIASPDAIFDIAVPGDQVAGVLRELPRGSAVLIQKPMGEDLAGASAIVKICHELGLVAAINFQLRFSPNVLALRDLLDAGELGEIVDIEVRLVVEQPWHLWTFLEGAPRVEILYHSIHYLDTIRALAGEPQGVYCRTVAHPAMREFRDTRSTIILDYGETLRCSLLLNHVHQQDATHRASMLKVEGTRGAALLTMGVNIDYPNGPPDTLEVSLRGGSWHQIDLRGSWFIEAFEGPMSNLQRYVSGEDPALVSPVDDAIKTMALVEACYQSSITGGTPVPEV